MPLDAASEVDYHLPAPGAKRRREILRLETERVLGNDWVVRQENRLYQAERQSRHHAPAKSKVTVCEWEDGSVEIQYRGQKLKWHEIDQRSGTPEVAKQKRRKPSTPPAAPMPDHPWREVSGHATTTNCGGRNMPAFRGLGLRSALSARPTAFAGLGSGRGHGEHQARKKRKGTLLTNRTEGHF